MAYFAKLDNDNKVIGVQSVNNDVLLDEKRKLGVVMKYPNMKVLYTTQGIKTLKYEDVIGLIIGCVDYIYEGEKILVERINVLGNNITNEAVIRSEMELDEGDPFTKLGLNKSVANLKARNIFKDVNYKISEGVHDNGMNTFDFFLI